MPNLTQDPAQLEPTNKHCTSTKMLKGKTIPKSKKREAKPRYLQGSSMKIFLDPLKTKTN
jgi:hypothetical protein